MTGLEVLTVELPSRDEYEQHVASMLRQGWTVQTVTQRSRGKRLLRLVNRGVRLRHSETALAGSA